MNISKGMARLRNDFQLGIVTLFGVITAALITPFAVFRSITGNLPVAALDWTLIGTILGAVFYAWRSGNVKGVGTFLCVTNCVGAVVSAELLGVVGFFWMYSAILANFFLASRRFATIATAVALITLVWLGKGFADSAQVISFAATSLLVATLAFVLANRTEAQRAQLEVLATRDPLTGAHNRRLMTEELAIAADMLRRQGGTFGVIILDIDHFKMINDESGHAEGDRVLVALTQIVKAASRSVDRFFRYGGEEFVLLLPAVQHTDLLGISEKLRSLIHAQLKSTSGAVTVSIGAATLRNNENWQQWLKRADAALYRAKAAGRNCVVIDAESALSK
jgi:diguanylate cyclase